MGKVKKAKASKNGKSKVTPLPEILTPAQAAAFLQFSESDLRAYSVMGFIPGRIIGSEWRYSRRALLKYIEESTGKPFPTDLDIREKSGSNGTHSSSKSKIRAMIGVWKDDPTIDPMIEEIERARKKEPHGGS